MTARVRDARPADLSALRSIQAAALAEPWQELLELAVDGPPILLVAEAGDGANSGNGNDCDGGNGDDGGDGDAGSSVGRSRSRPVGYALAVTDEDDAVGYLVELAVAPAAQDVGHGSALLDALLERLRERGVDRLRVTVRATDDRALSFYEERGFERRDRLPGHYESGDGLLLVRDVG